MTTLRPSVWLSLWCIAGSLASQAEPPALAPGPGRIEGVVLDATGRPVPNAEVWLGNETLPHTRSDAVGAFGFSRLSLGYHSVRATARGWHRASHVAQVTHEVPFQFARLVLLPAADVPVRVVDVEGTPIAGAEVMHSRTSVPGHYVREKSEVLKTDAAGELLLTDVALGETAIHAWAPGFGTGSTMGCVGDQAEVLIVLHRTRALELRLTLTGATPLQLRAATWGLHAVREGYGAGCNLPPSLVAGGLDDNGTATILGLPLDMDLQQIRIEVPDAIVSPRSATLTSAKASRQLLQELKFEVVPSQGLAVAGIALDPEGKPLAGLGIAWRSQETRTDANGAFTFPGLAAVGAEFMLRSLDQGWVFDQPKDRLYDAIRYRRVFQGKVEAGATWEVHCVPASDLRGRIENAGGRGVAGVDVRLMTQWEHGQNLSVAWAQSDRDGAFLLPQLNGTEEREVWIEAFSRDGDVRGEPFRMAVGESLRLPDLCVTEPGVIAGIVKDGQGKAVHGASLLLLLRTGDTADATISDRDGRFRLVAGSGQYELRCYTGHQMHGDRKALTVEVKSGATLELVVVRNRN